MTDLSVVWWVKHWDPVLHKAMEAELGEWLVVQTTQDGPTANMR
jgi:hypothetical protein